MFFQTSFTLHELNIRTIDVFHYADRPRFELGFPESESGVVTVGPTTNRAGDENRTHVVLVTSEVLDHSATPALVALSCYSLWSSRSSSRSVIVFQ